jgi:hypothetical protein
VGDAVRKAKAREERGIKKKKGLRKTFRFVCYLIKTHIVQSRKGGKKRKKLRGHNTKKKKEKQRQKKQCDWYYTGIRENQREEIQSDYPS